MKKLLPLIVGIAALATPNTALAQANNLDSIYLDALNTILIRNGNPLRNSVSEQGKIEDGVSMCQELDSGSTVANITRSIAEWAVERYSTRSQQEQASSYASVVFVVAVNVYCPEHRPAIDEYLERRRRN